MARFSEEEVFTLLLLVNYEKNQVLDNSREAYVPEYVGHLTNLGEKLNRYYDKHYPEDEYDGGH